MHEITLKKNAKLVLQRSENPNDCVTFVRGEPIYLHEEDPVAIKIDNMDAEDRATLFSVKKDIKTISIPADYERLSSIDLGRILTSIGKFSDEMKSGQMIDAIEDGIKKGLLVIEKVSVKNDAAGMNVMLKKIDEMEKRQTATESLLKDTITENTKLSTANSELQKQIAAFVGSPADNADGSEAPPAETGKGGKAGK